MIAERPTPINEEMPIQIGKYPVLRQLGRGATSKVYLARDPFNGREVAIKLIYLEPSDDSQILKRFQRIFLNEAALVGKFSHPHIVAIYDAVAGEDYRYIVMEHVPGGTLERFCKLENLLPLQQAVEIFFKCAGALEFAQRNGVIHRDIKPANILLTEHNDLKITDFGSAQHERLDETQLMGIGSPAYMSPEQIQEGVLTHQTDIYSLGVVMYQLLTGRLPFLASNNLSLTYQILNIEPSPPSTHRTDIPPELDRIVLRAIAKDLGQRYASWMDLSYDLSKVFDNLKLSTEHLTDTEKFNTVKQLSFFQDFNDVETWEVLRIGTLKKIPRDTLIIREGDQGDCFYILTDGEVKVTREGKLLNILRPGDCFGEMLYFSNAVAKRTTSIRAMSNLTVLEIKASSLNEASDACQVQFNKAFLRILIERLSLANARLSAA